MLVICETHPVQYHAPVFQALQRLSVHIHVIYGSNFSVTGYRDAEFQADFAWDTDLLSGYQHSFINTVQQGGPRCYDESRAQGLIEKIRDLPTTAILALGYHNAFDRGVIRASKVLKLPLMLRTEASDEAVQRSRWKSWGRDFLLGRLYRNCGAVMYVGQNALKHYKRLGVPQYKLFSSPYCVSTEAFQCDETDRVKQRERMRGQLGIAPNTRVAMFCGKLSQRKGVDKLLAAAKLLPSRLRDKMLILFVGEGAQRADLERIANQSPSIKIHITGFKNQSQLSPYYHASDVAVLPSIASETWGLVVNEALHHGLPCLASHRVGSSLDLIVPGETGEVIAAGDIIALASAMEKYLNQPFSVAQRAKCRAHVANYSVDHAAVGIGLAYAQCCNQKQSPS